MNEKIMTQISENESLQLIHFGNIVYQARTQHLMSVKDFIIVLKSDKYKINLTEKEVNDLENNRGNYGWLIPTLAEIYKCDEDWLYKIHSQTPFTDD